MMKILAMAAVLLLCACGGGDIEPQDTAIDPPKCGQGACR